jgi:hypothetical protein
VKLRESLAKLGAGFGMVRDSVLLLGDRAFQTGGWLFKAAWGLVVQVLFGAFLAFLVLLFGGSRKIAYFVFFAMVVYAIFGLFRPSRPASDAYLKGRLPTKRGQLPEDEDENEKFV